MKEKRKASHLLRIFCLIAKTQFKANVKIIRSDNRLEFISGPMKNFYGEHGIIHQTSCVGNPQQNRRAERKHHHILEVARALRFQANLPIPFWSECALAASYLINRTLSSVLKGKTPHEVLFRETPTYDHIKTFGSLCYAYRHQRHKDKFEKRSRKCVFVGYPFAKKGWKVYDLNTGEIFVSQEVSFIKEEFPFGKACESSPMVVSHQSHMD